MTFRLLHTSDWHLGQYFYGKNRAREHQDFLDWLLQQAITLNVDAIIVAGDIFDTSTPPSYAREMYFDFIGKLHETNCQLFILAGNHDSVAMLSESQGILAKLSCQVTSMASDNIEQQVFIVSDQDNNKKAVIGAVPFLRPRDILHSKQGQSVQEKQQDLQQAITTHYQSIFNNAKALAGDDIPIILTGHLTALGVKTSDSVRDIYIGSLDAFPASGFPAADYIALGHIHKNQKVAKSEHIQYSGSPLPLSFDEAKSTKYVNLVDFEDGCLKSVEPIEVPRSQALLMIKTELESVAQDVNEAVKAYEGELRDHKLWLDIEIESADYIESLTPKIKQLTDELPVEVLLVRRSKAIRKQMNATKRKETLAELSLEDVFASRLAQEDWSEQEKEGRRERIETLFKETVVQVEQKDQQLSLANAIEGIAK